MRRKQSGVLLCLLFWSVLGLSGCYEPLPPPQMVDTTPSSLLILPGQYVISGRSVRNRPIVSQVFGSGQDVTFILATIHGNEPAGRRLVRRLGRQLDRQPELLAGRTVVLLSTANPDGLVDQIRYNARGVDINRNFATANRRDGEGGGPRALSEPEARIIEQLVRQYEPDRIVSVHQPLACVDYDGPAESLAAHMANHCRLPVRKLGAKPGSLGSYAGETLDIPIVTLELPADASVQGTERLWRQYGRALLAAIVYPDGAP
ncbi:MAG: DUF2817 domain-containing protein [Phycisphaerales bacterium]|nr:MAG: DUF2817 domain-containing protein [Phycisphaerales bacterium]